MSPGVTTKRPGVHVDALLAKQGKADKVLLRRRIEFRRAQHTDNKMDQLRKKYKAININGAGANGDSKADKRRGAAAASSGVRNAADSPVDSDLVEASGFRRAAHSLFPSERLAGGWRQVRPIGPGLNNLGNICFLNSVLQCLTYTPALAEYLLSREHSSGCRVGDGCMLCRFEAHVVRALGRRENSAIAPKLIVARLKQVAKHMRVGRQEDSHEFLRLLVDSFQRALLHGVDPATDRRIQETTLVHQVFGGYLQSQVKCGRCNHESNTFEPLLDISLDIPNASSISKALRAFTRPEILTKDNRYRCDACTRLVDASKQMTVYRLPRVLTLQLKRFSPFGGGKVGRFVEYPLRLNMRPYISKNTQSPGPSEYSLYAVLVHAGGSARSGHYYCYVKSPASVWYEMNDSYVRQVSENTVLKQTAYLLFYEQCQASQDSVETKPRSPQVQQTDAQSSIQSGKKPSTKHATLQPSVVSASEDMEAVLATKSRKEIRLGIEKLQLATSADLDQKQKLKKKKKKSKDKSKSKNPESDSSSKGLDQLLQALPALGTAKVPPQEPAAEKDEKDAATSEWVVRKKKPTCPTGSAESDGANVVTWNESIASKRAKASAFAEAKSKSKSSSSNSDWSIASVRPNRASQYGASVESWSGGNSVADSHGASASDSAKKRIRRPDSYDAEYDRGRVKKVKQPKLNKFAATINPFQKVGERMGKKKR
ncbi:hypothetical protein GGI07_005622 [Coemansia sp. Benny D115]|nr:hypothetical protein GGI07_005622 [Coemansia sp. Benny D115]